MKAAVAVGSAAGAAMENLWGALLGYLTEKVVVLLTAIGLSKAIATAEPRVMLAVLLVGAMAAIDGVVLMAKAVMKLAITALGGLTALLLSIRVVNMASA